LIPRSTMLGKKVTSWRIFSQLVEGPGGEESSKKIKGKGDGGSGHADIGRPSKETTEEVADEKGPYKTEGKLISQKKKTGCDP